jgi:hypothetical protein
MTLFPRLSPGELKCLWFPCFALILCRHINLWFPISEQWFNPVVTCCSSNSIQNHLFKGITCLTQPKALNRSQKMPTICIQWFSEVRSVSVKVKVAFSMFVPFLNLICTGAKMLFDCECWFTLLNSNVSRTLHIDGSSDTDL